MKRLVPIPREHADGLRGHRETGPGYQVVSVTLKNGKRFEQVVASEGCVIVGAAKADGIAACR